MYRGSGHAAATMVLVGFLLLTVSPEAWGKTVDQIGKWPLKRLGYNHAPYHLGAKRHITFHYRLPPNARQGKARWYLIHVAFVITFSAESGPGLAYVSSLLNGRAASQVKFQAARTGENPRVTWSTVGLVHGRREGTHHSNRIVVTDDNYISIRGVRGGLNKLRIVVEQYDALRVRDVAVLPSTGIEISSKAPPKLNLRVNPSKETQAEDLFKVDVHLKNLGGLPAKRVKVTPLFDSRSLRPEGSHSLAWPSVSGERHGSLVFRALKPGDTTISLQVSSSANQPAANLGLRIAGSDDSFARDLARNLAWLLALVPALLVFIFLRLRSTFSRDSS